MEERRRSIWPSLLLAAVGVGTITIGLMVPNVPVGAQYGGPQGGLPPVFIPPRDVTNLMPIDVTHTTDYMNSLGPQPASAFDALSGIAEAKGFPNSTELRGPTDFIDVRKQGTNDEYTRESPYAVTLLKGTVLASVRRPSMTGLIHTPIADIAFSANSDAFATFEDGVVRVRNVDGMGQAIKVRINKGPGTGIAMSVAPGFELVVADHKLSRGDVRPNDGIMRRGTHFLDGGQAAVSEYNVEGALQKSALVQGLTQQQNGDAKARRVVADMSRMAAVLNQLNGTAGFAEK